MKIGELINILNARKTERDSVVAEFAIKEAGKALTIGERLDRIEQLLGLSSTKLSKDQK